MTTILETARIRLRQFTERDLETLATMVNDEDQMRFYPRPRTKTEALAWINRNLTLYRNHGFGFWFMESISTADFLGYCGIRPLTMAAAHEIEMGWHTRKDIWGQGLATEAARACRDVAFTQFGIPRLVAIIDPAHAASVRVAEKIGMRPEGETTLEGQPWLVYSVERT
jgi:RimJ/RimL family protein N-acetyltransferase